MQLWKVFHSLVVSMVVWCQKSHTWGCLMYIFFVFFAFYSSIIALYHMCALWLLEHCYLGCFWRVLQAWLCAWWSGVDRVPLEGVWARFFLFLVFHIVLIYCCMLQISLDWWLNALLQLLCKCLLTVSKLVDMCCSPCQCWFLLWCEYVLLLFSSPFMLSL